MLLAIAVGPAIIAIISTLVAPRGGGAFNTYENEYLKWPWRGGASHKITTLPGDHLWPIQQAVDFDLGYYDENSNVVGQPVHSSQARGERTLYDPSELSGCGKHIVIKDLSDNKYITYCHLSDGYGWDGQPVYQGQLVAMSGNTGTRTDGPHLHMQKDPEPYSGVSVSLFPIAGYTSSGQLGLGTPYPSDNAGVGDACGPPCYESSQIDSGFYSGFTAEYNNAGSYNWVGVTWDPYGYGVGWWVHLWTAGRWGGVAQNFTGPLMPASAIMQGYGLATVQAILWLNPRRRSRIGECLRRQQRRPGDHRRSTDDGGVYVRP